MKTPDLYSVKQDFAGTVARVAPDHTDLANRTLARVQPEGWQIEWGLPGWLSETYGLDAARARQLVLSNVLGLCSIRLQDDLADGEVADNERDSSGQLAALLYSAALDIYRAYFPPDSIFWEHVTQTMRAWRAATDRANQLNLGQVTLLRTLESGPAQCLAALGAPLKLCAQAVLLMTGQTMPSTLNDLLDHALIAAVLHDHALDCESDLQAGRWNLFVAAVSGLPQDPIHRAENRAGVARAWMMTGLPHLYFEQVDHHLESAARLNRAPGVRGLGDYLSNFRRMARKTRALLEGQYRQDLARATDALFGPMFAASRTRKGGAPGYYSSHRIR